MTKLNPNGTHLWLNSEGETCFIYNGDFYKVISINEHNQQKLETIRLHTLPISITLDQDGADTFKCILTVLKLDRDIGYHQDHCVVCIVECYQTKEKTKSTLGKFLTAITETTSTKNDGKDYHEIHPEGRLARGIKDGIPYQEVLDENGEATYMILVKENCLVGMYFSEECYAVVEVGNGKDIKDTIREVKNKSEFVKHIRDDEEDANLTDDQVICEYAYTELACPRWGMSW